MVRHGAGIIIVMSARKCAARANKRSVRQHGTGCQNRKVVQQIRVEQRHRGQATVQCLPIANPEQINPRGIHSSAPDPGHPACPVGKDQAVVADAAFQPFDRNVGRQRQQGELLPAPQDKPELSVLPLTEQQIGIIPRCRVTDEARFRIEAFLPREYRLPFLEQRHVKRATPQAVYPRLQHIVTVAVPTENQRVRRARGQNERLVALLRHFRDGLKYPAGRAKPDSIVGIPVAGYHDGAVLQLHRAGERPLAVQDGHRGERQRRGHRPPRPSSGRYRTVRRSRQPKGPDRCGAARRPACRGNTAYPERATRRRNNTPPSVWARNPSCGRRRPPAHRRSPAPSRTRSGECSGPEAAPRSFSQAAPCHPPRTGPRPTARRRRRMPGAFSHPKGTN